MTDPVVSIVIPTRNGAATLPALLDALSRQRVAVPFETIAVDSGSTDGSVELLRSRVDDVITIPADAFDHGLTRNAGIERARGELVVMIVQDAVPASDDWLSNLTAPLFADPGLAGSVARQRPRADASALTAYYLSRWAAAAEEPRTLAVDNRLDFEKLDPMEKRHRCVFDNVCSCLRRSVWASHPFRATPIGEDIEWAKEVLLAGHRIAYVPAAVVIHSHDRSAAYEFGRTRVLHRRLFELFGLRTIPTLPLLGRAIASSLVLHLRHQRDARAVALAFAWPLGQYLGARDAMRRQRAAR